MSKAKVRITSLIEQSEILVLASYDFVHFNQFAIEDL